MAVLVLAVVPATFIGCDKSQHSESVSKGPRPEITWDMQLEAALAGRSSEARYTARPIDNDEAQDLKSCDHLQTLEIDQSRLTGDQLADILAALPKLRQLKLTGPVDDEQLTMIAATRPQIVVLNLPEGSFTDVGLSELASLSLLELLRFHSSKVTDEGLVEIAKLPQLRFLHLINVPITDAGLSPLVGMTHLESFYLDGGQCTDEGLSELIEKRPDLHFHWNQLHLPSDPHSHPH